MKTRKADKKQKNNEQMEKITIHREAYVPSTLPTDDEIIRLLMTFKDEPEPEKYEHNEKAKK